MRSKSDGINFDQENRAKFSIASIQLQVSGKETNYSVQYAKGTF